MMLGLGMVLLLFVIVAYLLCRGHGYSRKQSLVIVTVLTLGLVIMKSIQLDAGHNALDKVVPSLPDQIEPCCEV